MEPKYEEQVTAFVDLLGFSEVSAGADETTRLKVLSFLLSLSTLRGEFNIQSSVQESGGTSFAVKPAISTFSDHIVISCPIQPLAADIGIEERFLATVVMHQFTDLITRIASGALLIGFLIRGGVTIGRLYHARSVVFGEGLVEAFQLESRTSVYPRVVVSQLITSRPGWIENQTDIIRDNDGLYHVDYFKGLLLSTLGTGNSKAWFDAAVAVIFRSLTDLEGKGRLTELSKWAWFARQFRAGLEKVPSKILEQTGISLDVIPWPK